MADEIRPWFVSRLPKSWFAGPPEVTSDSDEILVLGVLPDVELAGGTAPEAREAARVARIDRFREETREERVKIARDAERRFRRKVAWGRSDALAWCVRLVGMHQSDWLEGLREALVKVDEVRSKGPLN